MLMPPSAVSTVDDANPMLHSLGEALQAAGYILSLASGGDDALRKYQSSRPELILLDLSLPGTDGKDLLRRLRTLTAAPIVVVSARNEESEAVEAGTNIDPAIGNVDRGA